MSAHVERCVATHGSHRLKETKVAGFRVSDAQYRAGLTLPPHYHQFPCLTFVTRGMFVERAKHRTFAVAKHAILVKPAGEVHDDVIGERGVRSVQIELERLDIDAPSVACALDRPWLFESPRSIPIARDIVRELRTPDVLTRVSLEGLVLQLLAELGRSAGTRRGPLGRPRWLSDAIEFLRASFAQPVSLRDAARAAGVHPAHLARVFRRFEGTSVGQYVRFLRLEQAAHMLQTTNSSLADIARETGYCDKSHLAKSFKSAFGLTPAEYRNSR